MFVAGLYKLYLFGQQTRQKSHPLIHIPNARNRSQKCNLSPPRGWQEPNYLARHRCLPGPACLSRKKSEESQPGIEPGTLTWDAGILTVKLNACSQRLIFCLWLPFLKKIQAIVREPFDSQVSTFCGWPQEATMHLAATQASPPSIFLQSAQSPKCQLSREEMFKLLEQSCHIRRLTTESSNSLTKLDK